MNQPDLPPPSARRILTAAAAAFGAAALLLLAAVLPAEHGVDPLGTGRLLGLTALSAEPGPVAARPQAHRVDRVEFELGPFQSVEYKYALDAGAPMVFSWTADGGEVRYDLHAEPAGLGGEYAESFERGTAAARSGSFIAPFAGIHGWFWENRGDRAVLLRLHSAGFYTDSTVFRDGGDYRRVIEPVTR